MAAIFWAMLFKFRHVYSPLDVGLLVATAMSFAACLAWAAAAPASFAARREVALAALRVGSLAVPATPATLVAMLTHAEPWRLGQGPLAHASFILLFLLATGVTALLPWALQCPLRLPLHAAALLANAASQLYGCSTLQQPPSQAAVHAIHSLLSLLGLPWSGAGASNRPPASPAAVCWAVVAMVLVSLGLCLPTILLGAWEQQEFARYKERRGGQVPRSWDTWLYERAGAYRGDRWRWCRLAVAGWVLLAMVWDCVHVLAGT